MCDSVLHVALETKYVRNHFSIHISNQHKADLGFEPHIKCSPPVPNRKEEGYKYLFHSTKTLCISRPLRTSRNLSSCSKVYISADRRSPNIIVCNPIMTPDMCLASLATVTNSDESWVNNRFGLFVSLFQGLHTTGDATTSAEQP